MCQTILIMQSIAIGLLVVLQTYLFNQVKRLEEPEVSTREQGVVPATVFEDERIAVSVREVLIEDIPKKSLSARERGFPPGTLMSTTQVSNKSTGVAYKYHHRNDEDYLVAAPDVGATIRVKGRIIEKINCNYQDYP